MACQRIKMGPDLISRAESWARQYHANLVRPNLAQEPKIIHIAEVADLVKKAGGTPAQIAAAWLHDIVEDTSVTLAQIKDEFGDEIYDLVDGLTDPPDFAGLALPERKRRQADRLKTKRENVKLVKLADQTSNIKSVLNDPPTDWNAAKSLAYIQGAKQLADLCAGIAPELDVMFQDIYQQGVQKYGASLGPACAPAK